jgi:FkbM family methyltransferase
MSIAGSIVRLPLRCIPRGMVMTTLSGITRGMKWTAGAHTHGCWIGTYEREKQRLIGDLVKPGMTAVDIGANAGFYTLAFRRLGAEVTAIEPLAVNVQHLLRHLALNRLQKVTVIQAAVSDCAGLAHFRVGPNNAEGALTKQSTALVVPTVTLDSLPIPIPDIVKMDIEGGEVAALRGATRWIAAHKTTWLVAVHGRELAAETERIFAEADYTVKTIEKDRELIAEPRPGRSAA